MSSINEEKGAERERESRRGTDDGAISPPPRPGDQLERSPAVDTAGAADDVQAPVLNKDSIVKYKEIFDDQ